MKLKLTDLKPNPDNPRIISKEQFERLKKKIAKNPDGLTAQKIAHKDGIVIAGNQRWRAITELGLELKEEWFKDVTGWTDEQITDWLIDTNVSDGEWDFDMLANQYEPEYLIEHGVELPYQVADEEVEEDEPPEVESGGASVSNVGSVYQLGRHRLMCGDATDKANVELLMNGDKADMVFTDPPYGVEYTGGQFYSGKPVKNRREQIANDDVLIYDTSLKNIAEFVDSGAFYVAYASSFSIEVLSQLRDAGLEQRAIIIWNKTNTGYGDLNSNYKNNYEPIFYGIKAGTKSNFTGDTKQTTVWSMDKPKENKLHPTMKPIELVAKAISNSSTKGNVVADVFGGSGSTLIACEQLDRTCYMMELDPKYCDVIRKRYAKFISPDDSIPENWEELTPEIARV